METEHDVIRGIRDSLKIGRDVDLDSYADSSEASYLHPAEAYEQGALHRSQYGTNDGALLLPWACTHGEVKVRPGELSLWAGRGGAGKSLLTGQVALGFMTQGARVVIASMEMPILDTLERLERQAFGLARPSNEALKRFYRWVAGKCWLYDQAGAVASKRILGLCRYAITKLKVQHVVVDSLMQVELGHPRYQLDLQTDFARSLATICRDTGGCIHLVAHNRKAPPGSHAKPDGDDVAGSANITNVASMVYIVSRNLRKQAERTKAEHERKHDDEPDLFLTVDKQRRGIPGSCYGLWLHADSLQHTSRAGKRMRMVPELIEVEEAAPVQPPMHRPWEVVS